MNNDNDGIGTSFLILLAIIGAGAIGGFLEKYYPILMWVICIGGILYMLFHDWHKGKK